MKTLARPALRSAATSISTMAGVRIRALTERHPIKPTSPRCHSAWQLNLGRHSTYRRGKSVQTTGTTSDKPSSRKSTLGSTTAMPATQRPIGTSQPQMHVSNSGTFSSRVAGTPEENAAIVQGTIAYFGTYSVSVEDHLVTVHVEGGTFPNWVGTDQKRLFTIIGDELRYTNFNRSSGEGTALVVWKRAK